MVPEVIYSKYSQAMFDIAKEQNKLDEFGTQLKAVRDTFIDNPELKKFMGSPLIPAVSKKNALKQIFASDVAPLVLQFLFVMVDRQRESAITEAIDSFVKLARAAQNIEIAKVRVVKALTKDEEKDLVAALERTTGKKIEPLYYIDPSIIGGMVVQIGDRLIDGSLLRQLQDMQYALLQSDVVNEVTDKKWKWSQKK